MPERLPVLGAVVVAYGNPDHLRSCLAALRAPSGAVVVVDNGLSEEARTISSSHAARYLRPTRNLGFSGGVNTGLAEVGEDVDVLLLNPDATIGWDDVLRLQSKLHEQPTRAAVAPRLVRPDGSEEPATWPMPSPRSVWLDAMGLSGRVGGARFLTGAVLLLRGQALREIGPFDERYFLYAEEADWQLRALRGGWSVSVAEDLVAGHLGGATSSSGAVRSEHFHRSARLFARKWYGSRGAAVMRVASIVAAARRSITGGRAGRGDAAATLRTYLRNTS